jgi:hypothetical protein
MAVVPFHEQAMAHWSGEVDQARQGLLASLEEVRSRTDQFITVSALATTLFAVLTNGASPNGSNVNGSLDPVPDTGSPSETPSRTPPALRGDVSVRAKGRCRTPYPDAEGEGIVHFPGAAGTDTEPG